jgi:predicted nucleotide-binding protein
MGASVPKTICVLDDDFAMEALVEHLVGRGYDVTRLSPGLPFQELLEKLVHSDLVIIDVMMERPAEIPETSARGGHRTGLVIAQELRKQSRSLPILAYSATHDREVQRWFQDTPNAYFLSKYAFSSLEDITGHIDAILGADPPTLPRPFIVHGHDETAKLALKNYLQNILGLPEPLILHEQASHGRLLLEKFEYYAAEAQLVFVLLTPDDLPAVGHEPNTEKRRARQNVIFELGYFLAILRRSSGRVLILHKGQLDLPSDISGLAYIDISGGIEAAGEPIRRELRDVIKRAR